ncbi:MAG: response regulator [Candidatus Daviesbacteria bacterium]|nr:response regulator [Candidatus Daviesbacteria bacterium]
MAPENAKVFIAEDVERWQETIRRKLEQVGHSVVLTASTLSEAIEEVKKFRDKGIQVAVIDGNMNSGNSGGQDGEILLAAIRSTTPEVKVVGMSSHPIEGVDINVLKGNERFLGRVVKEL